MNEKKVNIFAKVPRPRVSQKGSGLEISLDSMHPGNGSLIKK